jgi:hypothetical protein
MTAPKIEPPKGPLIPWPLLLVAALIASYSFVGLTLHWVLLGATVDWCWLPSLIVIFAWPVLIGSCALLVTLLDQVIAKLKHRSS